MDGGSLEDLVQAGGCDDEGVLASIAAQVLQVRAPRATPRHTITSLITTRHYSITLDPHYRS